MTTMTRRERVLADEPRMKSAKGKASLLKFVRGEPITPKEGIYAKCYDCQSYYEDITGDRDCHDHDCPLYPFFQYSSDRSQNLPSIRMKERMASGDFQPGFFSKKEGASVEASSFDESEEETPDETAWTPEDEETCEEESEESEASEAEKP